VFKLGKNEFEDALAASMVFKEKLGQLRLNEEALNMQFEKQEKELNKLYKMIADIENTTGKDVKKLKVDIKTNCS